MSVVIGRYKIEKLKSLCKNSDLSDCVFIVNDEKIPAHKLILACSSPVFEKMLYGQMASNEIIISDIDMEEFKQMLDFVYTDNICITSIVNAWSLVYVANKYLIDDLLEACINHIEKNLEINTLLLSYECADMYNQQNLKTKCWNDITTYTKGVIETEYHMKSTTLCNLLDDEVLNVEEKDLIICAGRWAKEECILRKLEPSKINISGVLKEYNLLKRLRFLAVPQKDYHTLTDLFCLQDIYNLMLNSSNRCNKQNARNSKMYVKSYKFRDTYKIARNFIVHQDDCLSSEITVNHRIIVFGVVVSTEHEPFDAHSRKYQGGFIIQICKNCNNKTQIVAEVDEPCSTLDYDSIKFINFNKFVLLEPNINYRITVRYKSGNPNSRSEVIYYYLSQILYTKKNCAIKFYNELNGSVLRGVSFYPA